ncbi:MAG TPA: beta-galactosidase [Solirubrobacteraceae bacterium]|nr:beta-galactosidase [Solirubrobacteraceae bacterium]
MRRNRLAVVAALAVACVLALVPLAEASGGGPAVRHIPARAWAPHTASATSAAGSAPAANGGSAAGCAVATPSEAGAASPGAPTDVHAIAGDGSVTVTWCAPTQGQGNVTSYTVTGSDGSTSTVDVPNQWTIIDNLKNGTGYTFTVKANTASGSSDASPASNSVTPAPIAPPTNVDLGAKHTVSYDQYSLMIDGKRTLIYSGEFDPWRTPSPSLWLDLLQKMKADGFNAVTPYFDWDYSSPAPGRYDFSGVRDMNTFLNDAQKAGLYVIARPGPYINAETDGGGFPGWLVTQKGKARTNAADYEAAAKQWLSEIDPIIAAHQITRGGDVILYQVENELFYREPATINYMADLIAKVKADGIDVPLTGNHSGTFNGTPGAVQIDGYDSYPQGFNCANPRSFGTPGAFSPFAGEPLMLPEFQGGSYDSWGGSGYDNCYEMTNSDFENVFYKSNFADGVTIQSNYMTVGGTNWGWLPAPFMYTSYDYGSAIREDGEIGTPANPNDISGSKYGENKLLGDFLQSQPSLAKTQPVAAPASSNPAVTVTARANPDDKTQFIYLRQSNASSTANASTHLALNTDPSFGYTYDDTDAALSYTGNWSHVSNQSYTGGDYKNTESFSNVTGDSMSVSFTGTAVQYIAPTASNHGIADVYLDGTKVATVDGYSAGTNFQKVLYSASGLANTTHTLKIVVTGQKNAASGGTYVSVDAINVPTAAQQADSYPSVPQQPGTAITLQGRDAKLLVANDQFDGQQLQYSTSELMTHADLGGSSLGLLYGPAGTDGETVLRYANQPNVTVLSGSVQSTWDSSRGDLRLDYTHTGLAEVKISGGGRPGLLLLIAEKNLAEDFWPEATSAGQVLVRGAYLVRGATTSGGTLALTGDTSSSGPITVWAPASVTAVTWNGQSVATTRQSDGSLTGTLHGPAAVTLPALSNWKFRFETPEAQPFYDDSSWTLADHQTTTNPTPPVTTPVLYADDYGFHHGFIWYRGHFSATGSETGITLTADGGQHGALSVWLNGAYIGANSSGNQQTKTFSFPAAALRPGADNVVAVLVQSSGHDEDGVYGSPPGDGQKSPRGLMGAKLNGGGESVTWRLQGNRGGEQLQDPTRGPLNATGLYGTNHGWDLPGYPDDSWSSVSLPDAWNSRGVPEGIGWYRTTFSLNEPTSSYSPVAVQMSSLPNAGNANSRAFIFVNGWLIGQYDNQQGPQTQFYVPAGILNPQGQNTLAIAEWALAPSGGGLGAVKLVSLGNQAGGVPVTPVSSPAYSAAVYGTPSAGQPTLALTSSSRLAEPAKPFKVTATLSNQGNEPMTGSSVILNAPSGWAVSPPTVSLGKLVSGQTAQAVFTVTPPSSGLQPGPVPLVAKASYQTPSSGGTQTLQSGVTVEVPYQSLAQSYDNSGITDDANPKPSSGFVGFDGEGTTFSAQGLASDGLTPGASVNSDGLAFTWPNVPSAQPDNTMAEGQIFDISGHGSKLGFLAASNNGPQSGTGTVYYTDGSSSTFTLSVGNFWYPAGQNGNPANTQLASVNYANYPTGSSGHTVYVFEQSVPIDPTKTVEAVALPTLGDVAGYNPAMHIFAASVGG